MLVRRLAGLDLRPKSSAASERAPAGAFAKLLSLDIVWPMRSFRIRAFRKIGLLSYSATKAFSPLSPSDGERVGVRGSFVGLLTLCVVLPAVVLFGAGCSSFNRDWKKTGRSSAAAAGLEGRWEGQWISEVNGHHGRLRCIVQKQEDVYQARFRAKYRKILSFGYTVPLRAEPIDNGYKFRGEADLGTLAGGVYHYEGHADATSFFSTYSC